jgi:hypothetical protein
VRPRRPIPFVRRCQKPLELRARKFVKRATQKNVNWLGRDALFLVADASGVTKARFVGSLSDKSWQATKSDKSSVRREAFAGLILLLGPHPVEIGPGTVAPVPGSHGVQRLRACVRAPQELYIFN